MAKSSNVEVETTVPDRLSPEWHDYVMSQFHETELVDGYPTVAGLRRLSEKFIGEIVKSRPTAIWPCTGDNLGRATVSYEVQFMKPVGGFVSFEDVADVWAGNTDENFVAFAVSVAATRAEARALRKALKLRTVAIEELAKKPMTVSEDRQNDDLISPNQINFIDSRCQQLNINVVKFMNAGERVYRSVNEVLKSTASKMIKQVNIFMNEPKTIPEELKGYQSNWQTSFKA